MLCLFLQKDVLLAPSKLAVLAGRGHRHAKDQLQNHHRTPCTSPCQNQSKAVFSLDGVSTIAIGLLPDDVSIIVNERRVLIKERTEQSEKPLEGLGIEPSKSDQYPIST